jgi:polyisoprenoid-binding protein YceI
MSRRVVTVIGGLILLAVVIGGGAAIYWFVSAGSGEASTEISSEQLEASDDSTQQVFRIDKEASEVRFLVDETLAGREIVVTGRTNEIAGDILVDYENPQASEIGTIRINMRTLATDNEFRNRALRNDILLTSDDQNEFSDFVVTEVNGLPETVTIGEPFEVTIVGTLTLRGEAQPVTFDATITPVSETEISGTATSVVRYEDVGVDIPNVPPQVANIGEEVTLELDFVARAVDGDADDASATQEATTEAASG